MKPALLVVVVAFLLPGSSFAQVPSVVESDALQAGPHDWRKVLRNQSPSSMVAYTVSCVPERGLTTLNDVLINGGLTSIQERASKLRSTILQHVRLASTLPSFPTAILRAIQS